jgi:hypothetical protein
MRKMQKNPSGTSQVARSQGRKCSYIQFVVALIICTIATPALAKQHWGSFKDNGCVTQKSRKFRVYSSVLWGIPWGESWEVACSKMPATVHGVHFSHPTACVKTSVVDAMSITGAVLGVAGMAFPPIGAAGAVLGVTTVVMDKSGVGALNMWGVFYVQVPKCK